MQVRTVWMVLFLGAVTVGCLCGRESLTRGVKRDVRVVLEVVLRVCCLRREVGRGDGLRDEGGDGGGVDFVVCGWAGMVRGRL